MPRPRPPRPFPDFLPNIADSLLFLKLNRTKVQKVIGPVRFLDSIFSKAGEFELLKTTTKLESSYAEIERLKVKNMIHEGSVSYDFLELAGNPDPDQPTFKVLNGDTDLQGKLNVHGAITGENIITAPMISSPTINVNVNGTEYSVIHEGNRYTFDRSITTSGIINTGAVRFDQLPEYNGPQPPVVNQNSFVTAHVVQTALENLLPGRYLAIDEGNNNIELKSTGNLRIVYTNLSAMGAGIAKFQYSGIEFNQHPKITDDPPVAAIDDNTLYPISVLRNVFFPIALTADTTVKRAVAGAQLNFIFDASVQTHFAVAPILDFDQPIDIRPRELLSYDAARQRFLPLEIQNDTVITARARIPPEDRDPALGFNLNVAFAANRDIFFKSRPEIENNNLPITEQSILNYTDLQQNFLPRVLHQNTVIDVETEGDPPVRKNYRLDVYPTTEFSRVVRFDSAIYSKHWYMDLNFEDLTSFMDMTNRSLYKAGELKALMPGIKGGGLREDPNIPMILFDSTKRIIGEVEDQPGKIVIVEPNVLAFYQKEAREGLGPLIRQPVYFGYEQAAAANEPEPYFSILKYNEDDKTSQYLKLNSEDIVLSQTPRIDNISTTPKGDNYLATYKEVTDILSQAGDLIKGNFLRKVSPYGDRVTFLTGDGSTANPADVGIIMLPDDTSSDRSMGFGYTPTETNGITESIGSFIRQVWNTVTSKYESFLHLFENYIQKDEEAGIIVSKSGLRHYVRGIRKPDDPDKHWWIIYDRKLLDGQPYDIRILKNDRGDPETSRPWVNFNTISSNDDEITDYAVYTNNEHPLNFYTEPVTLECLTKGYPDNVKVGWDDSKQKFQIVRKAVSENDNPIGLELNTEDKSVDITTPEVYVPAPEIYQTNGLTKAQLVSNLIASDYGPIMFATEPKTTNPSLLAGYVGLGFSALTAVGFIAAAGIGLYKYIFDSESNTRIQTNVGFMVDPEKDATICSSGENRIEVTTENVVVTGPAYIRKSLTTNADPVLVPIATETTMVGDFIRWLGDNELGYAVDIIYDRGKKAWNFIRNLLPFAEQLSDPVPVGLEIYDNANKTRLFAGTKAIEVTDTNISFNDLPLVTGSKIIATQDNELVTKKYIDAQLLSVTKEYVDTQDNAVKTYANNTFLYAGVERNQQFKSTNPTPLVGTLTNSGYTGKMHLDTGMSTTPTEGGYFRLAASCTNNGREIRIIGLSGMSAGKASFVVHHPNNLWVTLSSETAMDAIEMIDNVPEEVQRNNPHINFMETEHGTERAEKIVLIRELNMGKLEYRWGVQNMNTNQIYPIR